MKCDHCGKDLGVSIIYDHSKKYHPHCYPIAFEEKMREMVKKSTKNQKDWSEGLYET